MHATRRSRDPRGPSGITLVEVLLVLVVLGVLLGMAWPRFGLASEQARVDMAAGVLRSVWLAQRLHHLETGAYADDFAQLAALRLLDATVAEEVQPFSYALEAPGPDAFTAQALRAGSSEWSGALAIDEGGGVSGSTVDLEGRHVLPAGG